MKAVALLRYLGFILSATLIYVAVAVLGISFSISPGNVTPFYPAAGLAFGAYLALGRKVLPAIFLGAFLSNLLAILRHSSGVEAVSATLVIGAGEVLASVAAGALLWHFCKNSSELLDTPKNVLLLFAIALFWLVSPSIGVTSLALFGLVEWRDFAYTWLTWWLGDAIGVMLITPLLLLLSLYGRRIWHEQPPFSLLLALLLYCGVIVGLGLSPWPIAFLLLPATMLLVLEYELVGALLASIVGGIAVLLMVVGGTLFSDFDLNQRLLLLQMLVGVNTFTAYFLAAHVRTIKNLLASVSEARRESEIDPLTALLNRRGFEHYSTQILQQARQNDRGLSLILIDLDNFKEVNDRFGHDAGDEVLRGFARILKQVLRSGDLAARIGGEEFVLLLAAASSVELEKVTRRLLGAVAGLQFDKLAPGYQLTFSGGIAHGGESSELDKLMQAADRRLYIAKRTGKNQLVWP